MGSTVFPVWACRCHDSWDRLCRGAREVDRKVVMVVQCFLCLAGPCHGRWDLLRRAEGKAREGGAKVCGQKGTAASCLWFFLAGPCHGRWGKLCRAAGKGGLTAGEQPKVDCGIVMNGPCAWNSCCFCGCWDQPPRASCCGTEREDGASSQRQPTAPAPHQPSPCSPSSSSAADPAATKSSSSGASSFRLLAKVYTPMALSPSARALRLLSASLVSSRSGILSSSWETYLLVWKVVGKCGRGSVLRVEGWDWMWVAGD